MPNVNLQERNALNSLTVFDIDAMSSGFLDCFGSVGYIKKEN